MRNPRRARHPSLAARLAGWYAVSAFLLVAASAFVQYRSLAASLAEEDDADLLLELRTASQSAGDRQTTRQGDQAENRDNRFLVRLFDRACHPTQSLAPDAPPAVCASTTSHQAVVRDWRSPAGARWRIAQMPLADGTGGWVEVLLDRSNDEGVLRDYREELVVVLAVALALAAALGYGLARHGLRPLQSLARRVRAIDERSLGQSLRTTDDSEHQPAEVEALVASFDDMRQRLERAFAALTQYAGELAHELRTPIHVLRQQAEVALRRVRTPEEYREVLASTLEELDRMRRMVDDILFLARAEDPRAAVDRVLIQLDREIGDVIDFLSADAIERHVALSVDAACTLELLADRMLVRRALVNVISNALRHTPAGGHIHIVTRLDAGNATVAVTDNGAGIPAALQPRIFDRYVRDDDSRLRDPTGAGLGLAIVRSIMSLHGGTASASSSPGTGTCITLRFPLDPMNAASVTGRPVGAAILSKL